MCAQDIEWDLPEVEGIPFTGKRHGLNQVADFFRILAECQAPREFKPDQFIGQDDQVAVLGYATFAVKASGAEFSGDWCHVFRIAGGKIASFKEYDDTYRAAQAYQGRARSPALLPARAQRVRPSINLIHSHAAAPLGVWPRYNPAFSSSF
jgi:ketosteroid isomerase-like protein